MASETNELTFVRCPTCRSLVPASASRCRICNATLDAGSKGASGEAPPAAGGRVRQKTVAAGPDEVKGMVAGSVPPTPSAPTSPPPVSSAPVKERVAAPAVESNEDEVFDPLGAFLQDLDSPVGGETKSSSPQPKQIDESTVNLFDDDDDDDDDGDDDLDDEIDDLDLDDFDDPLLDDTLDDVLEQNNPLVAKENPLEVQEEAQGNEGTGLELQETQDFFDDPLEDEPRTEARSEISKPAPPASRKEPVQREAPRPPETKKPQNRDSQQPAERAARPTPSSPAPRVAAGNIRPRIGGLPQRAGEISTAARGTRSVDEQGPPSPRASDPRDKHGRAEPSPTQPHQKAPVPQKSTVPQKPPVPQKPTLQQNPVVQSAGAQVRGMTDGAPARAQARSAAEKSAETAEGAGVRTSKSKQGRLFGWLVSYENPDGRAIELRAGRFFVTGTSIRPTDLILEDQSISTPHALMAITESGLQLQDLMSERGTFVRCQGEAQYVRQDGVIEVQHGDWIRFGDVEFLVTVVPS